MTDTLWFIQQQGNLFAICFDRDSSAQIEKYYLQMNHLDFTAPIIKIEEYEKGLDPSQEILSSPRAVEYLLDYKSMEAINNQDQSIRHKIMRIDPNLPLDMDGKMLHTFVWPYEGVTICIRGSFDNWSTSIYLHQDPSSESSTVTLLLPRHSFQYKFIVDGNWMYRNDLHHCYDEHGNINNYVSVDE
ncbi:putative Glycogen recognition site of AMP-activated protein kinase [Blattamonas nauphoetae]|uniref:Glycogen recognition site of AMP-activated protein kinase n=1 Tax=Blattamonas nauphoetae TaxID=2049346 RepID=A0ABQ9XAB2_9EUKA|nr:putative Glycogen recognition site of AMP-activated protein kinase [Blattamonas nauphoetae]